MSSLRLLVRMINAATAVAVLLIGLGALLVASETGSAWIAAYGLARMPGEIRVGSIEGTLAGTLVLNGVSVRTPRGLITADNAALAFSGSSLLAGSAVLNRVDLRDVVFSAAGDTGGTGGAAATGDVVAADAVAGANAAAGVSAGRAVPPVVVRAASANAVTLRAPDSELRLYALTASGNWIGSRIVVDAFQAESTGVALTGRGEVDWSGAVAVEADLSWAGRFGGSRAAGQLQVAGALPRLELRHALLSPMALILHADATANGGALDLEPLALDTDRGTLTGRGTLSLATTEWELTLDGRGNGSSRPPSGAGTGLRFGGQLLPTLAWQRLP